MGGTADIRVDATPDTPAPPSRLNLEGEKMMKLCPACRAAGRIRFATYRVRAIHPTGTVEVRTCADHLPRMFHGEPKTVDIETSTSTISASMVEDRPSVDDGQSESIEGTI